MQQLKLARYQFAGKLELATLLFAIAAVIAIAGYTAIIVVGGRCGGSSIVGTIV